MRYGSATTLPICTWIDFTKVFNRVNVRIAYFAAISSKIFVCYFCFDKVHGSPVLCPWQLTPQLFKDAFINWGRFDNSIFLLLKWIFCTYEFISALTSWHYFAQYCRVVGRTAMAARANHRITWLNYMAVTNDFFK